MAQLTKPIRISSELSGRKPPKGARMPFSYFIETIFDHHHYEWSQGAAHELDGVDSDHDRIVGWLKHLLGLWLEENNTGQLLARPFLMRLPEIPSARMPDIQVILTKNLGRLKRLYLDGPADVVIEIISTGSRSTDRRTKFTEYEQAGVPEYWLIDPLRRQAEFYVLEKKRFIPAPVDEEKGHFHSHMLPGVWLDVDWLWKHPPKKQILKRWGVS